MKREELILLILSFVVIVGIFFSNKREFDYDSNPETKEYNDYEYKHPIQAEIKPFYPNHNTIKIRRFIINGCVYYGELDGRSRTPFTHAGLSNCPKCKNELKNILKELLKELFIWN